jgi:ATP-dependent helicase HrpB
LLPHSPPEILQADLTPLVLELAHWGVHDVSQLQWLDVPPAAHVAQATDLLQKLGALDAAARLTVRGRAMLKLGVHPRLAHMMLRGRDLGYGSLACELVALLGERDLLRGVQPHDADIVLRLELLRGIGRARDTSRGLLGQIRATARQWQRQLHFDASPEDHADLRTALLAPLPWVKQKRLDELAPTHLTVPSGSRVRLDYSHQCSPYVCRKCSVSAIHRVLPVAGLPFYCTCCHRRVGRCR